MAGSGESAELAADGLPYSVKVEQTAKGARATVHVYAKDIETAADDAVMLLRRVEDKLQAQGFKLAPVESK